MMPTSVQCAKCYHYQNDWCKQKKDSPDPHLVRDCQYYRCRTNGDRIRQMSDEELAVLCENGCPPNYPCPDFEEFEEKEIGKRELCQRCWLDWLKKEAAE